MSWGAPARPSGHPGRTSGPPHHDLPYPPLFDEAELDNDLVWMKKGAPSEKECPTLRERIVGDDRRRRGGGELTKKEKEKKRSKAGLSLFMPQRL